MIIALPTWTVGRFVFEFDAKKYLDLKSQHTNGPGLIESSKHVQGLGVRA